MSLAPAAMTAGVAAATTWASFLGWRGFTEDPGSFLRPLLALAVVVAATGALARWRRLPAVAVVALQVAASAMVASWSLVGTALPVGPAWDRLLAGFGQAVATANGYAAPVPDDVPGIHPLLVGGGLACLLLVDALACTARRVPLAGLPLLAAYSVPVSILDAGPPWWVFTLTAAGFLTLLFRDESDQVVRWGRLLGDDGPRKRPGGLSVRTGASRASAGAIGGGATALALALPLTVPTWDLHLLDFGPGTGSDEIELSNPMVDLRRDLLRDEDVPLVRVSTQGRAPSYLRISVLNRFAGNEWSSGDRAIPTDQVADGAMPELEGVDASVERREHRYRVEVTDAFDSRWLPTQAPVSAVTAPGDWRYDRSTMDFIAGDEDLSAAGLSYEMTAVDLERDPASMTAAPSSAGMVSHEFLQLPAEFPSLVRDLAARVSQGAASPFEKAVALQHWFREEGGFTYSLEAEPGNGTDDLVRFLSEGPGGRTGYCEQFAAAYAVMARALDIPARVAVGFLSPERVGASTYEYSSFDLHAWPELFIPGSGWVRFEPTPPDRASGVPAYTQVGLPAPQPDRLPSGGAQPTEAENEVRRGIPGQDIAQAEADRAAAVGRDGSGFPWVVAAGLLVAALTVGLAMVPRAARRSRRRSRLAGGPEDVWAELRDTAVDLGIPWPAARSPRETGQRLAPHLGAPDRGPEERPAGAAQRSSEAVPDLDRLVSALERQRYARPGAGPGADGGACGAEGAACVAALEAGVGPRTRRRAAWWPRSLFRRAPRPDRQRAAPDHARPVAVETLDRVG